MPEFMGVSSFRRVGPMWNQLVFRCGDDANVRSREDLRRGLAAELGSPHAVAIDTSWEKLELVDSGITLSLIYDADGNLMSVVAAIPQYVDLAHVADLCKAFLALGWSM